MYILNPTVPVSEKDTGTILTESSQGCNAYDTAYDLYLDDLEPTQGYQGRLMEFHPADISLLAGIEVYLTLGQNTQAVVEIWNATEVGDLDNLQPVARRETCTAYGNKVQPLFTMHLLGESSSPRWSRAYTVAFAGRPLLSPVARSNRQPCMGHRTKQPAPSAAASTVPLLNGPCRCGQALFSA